MRPLPLPPVPPLPDGIEVPAVARAQDGVFSRSQARLEGWGDRRQRRLLRSGLWIPLAGPVLRHREVPVGPWQLARAVHLTTGLVASHHTAAQLWQFDVASDLHGIGRTDRSPRPVTVHRIALEPDDVCRVRGIPVTNPDRTLTDLMCSLDEEAGISMLSSGFRRGQFTARDVLDAARRAHNRHGVQRARHLAHMGRREPHSPLEWRFHGLIDAVGPGWEFNVDIYDRNGFVGRVDALHRRSGVIVELDGRGFHGDDYFQSDRTRDQRLAALGFVVIRFTWEDVDTRPMDVVERTRSAVAVRTREGRTSPWQPPHSHHPAGTG